MYAYILTLEVSENESGDDENVNDLGACVVCLGVGDVSGWVGVYMYACVYIYTYAYIFMFEVSESESDDNDNVYGLGACVVCLGVGGVSG